jgi:WD40 repeat protein
MPRFLVLFGLFSFAFLPWLRAQDTKKKDEPIPEKVSYYKHVRPIIQLHCQGCHQPAKAQGGYVMTSHADLLKKTDRELPGILPGQPDKSSVFQQITPHDGKPPAMPRQKDPLTNREVALFQKWIAQGAEDDTPASAKALAIDMQHAPVYELPPVITGLAFSPDSSLLAVTGYHEVLLHKGDGTELVARLVGLSERIQAVAFSPDGKFLAATGGNPGSFGEVQIWDVAKKKLKLSLPVTFDTLYGARWSHDSKLISFGCADNSLRVIEAETGKEVLFQGGHNDWVLDTVFSKDSSHLVSVSRDRTMKLTEVPTQRLVDNITSITPGALKGGLISVDRHPQKDDLAMGGADGVPKIYQMYRTKDRKIGDDFNLIRAFPGLPGRIYGIRFSADGNRIVAGSSSDGKGEVRVYNANDAKQIAKMEKIQGGIFAVAYRPDGQAVASAGFAGTVYLHNPDNGKLIRDFIPVPLTAKTSAR